MWLRPRRRRGKRSCYSTRGRRLLASTVVLALLALPAGAGRRTLFWSVPISLDTDGGVPLGPIACPTDLAMHHGRPIRADR